MTGKRWALAAVAVGLVAGVGCVNYRYKGYQESLCPAVPSPYPPPIRNQVYLFMMNGSDVLECAGMIGLRDKLCEAGYPMVYYAQRQDVAWYCRELRRVARDEPEARLLLLGYGSAADRVETLAFDAARDGLPVDSVIFLDPVGASGDLSETLPFHSTIIRSHGWRWAPGLVAVDSLRVQGVGHYSLPNHPATVQAVVDQMTVAAGRVQLEPPDRLPRLPLTDKPAKTPRGIDPATLAYPPDEWDFLKPGPPFPTLPPVSVPEVGRCQRR